jgi:hypothetical protein
MKLHTCDVLRLAAEAGRHPDTIRGVLQGRGNEMSKRAVLEAARRLGIVLGLAPVPTRIRAT